MHAAPSFPRFSLPTALVLLALCPAPVGASPQRSKKAVEPIVLGVDESKRPTGPVAAPRGELLDPRDLPKEVVAHFPSVDGLKGLERSLPVLLARHVGFAVEGRKLKKAYRPHAEALRDNWNELVGDALGALEPNRPERWSSGVLYQDTGRRPNADFTELRVVSAPELRMAAFRPGELDELTRIAGLIAGFGADMTAESVEELAALAEPIVEDTTRDTSKNPWFLHAYSQLTFAKLGIDGSELIENNPFDISVEEFYERCRKGLERELLDRPELPEEITVDRVFFDEGLVIVRIVPDEEDASAWTAPESLVEHNERTHEPVLVVTVAPKKRYTAKTKLKRVRIGVLAGGRDIELYDGRWPLR